MAARPAPPGAPDLTPSAAGVEKLLRALLRPTAAERLGAWRAWRDSADLDQLSAAEFQMLPLLGGFLGEWLQGDPAAGIFRGILRRAWTETQVNMNALRSTAEALERSGCGPVLATGAPAICLLNRHEASVRPVLNLCLLVPRDRLEDAVTAAQQAGWRMSSALPGPDARDWAAAAHLTRGGLNLLLYWRALPVPAEKARSCEECFRLGGQTVRYGGGLYRTPGPEQALLAALCGRFASDADPVPWEADAALVPTAGIDWKLWTRLAAAYAPEAFPRLARMRELGLEAPAISPPAPAPPSRPPARLFDQPYRRARRWGGRLLRGLIRRVRNC